MKNLLLILFLIFSCGFLINFNDVYGHGVGSEIFPPVELDGKLVSVEVSSSTKDDIENDDQQISVSLIDFDSKITLRDVTFLIKSEIHKKILKIILTINQNVVNNFFLKKNSKLIMGF